MSVKRVVYLQVRWQHKKHAIDASRVENIESIMEPRIHCLGTLRSHKRALPGDGIDVCCHATPAANEHLAVVEVSSEDPPGSAWVSLRTVDIRMRLGARSSGKGHVPVDARVRSGHPTVARGQGMYIVPKPCCGLGPSTQNGHFSMPGDRCKR